MGIGDAARSRHHHTPCSTRMGVRFIRRTGATRRPFCLGALTRQDARGSYLIGGALASNVLRSGVAPCRAYGLHRQPSLREHASLDSVGLQARPTAQLAGLGISPLEREAKPSAIAFERVIVYNNTYIWPLLPDFGDLRCVGVSC